jgi:hypothetical protein
MFLSTRGIPYRTQMREVMQRIRILTANAGALGDQLEDAVFANGPDVVALTGIGAARALRLAAPRSMRAATQSWSGDENAGLALLWKAGLAVGSLDRFDFGQSGEPRGALRIAFPLDGRHVSVYCAFLSSEHAVPPGEQTRLAELIDAARQPTLAACEGAGAETAEPWSRCADAWTTAQRRVVTLAASSDAGLAAQRAFGIARETAPVDVRSLAGPIWLCSEEFAVLETRSVASAGLPGLVRTATVALRASAADENVAIAL